MIQEPRTNRERSPWATVSILIVVILFGLFWIWQKSELVKESAIIESQTGASETAVPQSIEPDFSSLEASTVNISIPNFSSVF